MRKLFGFVALIGN